eukprot:747117-Hanusia_phi.AAC.7
MVEACRRSNGEVTYSLLSCRAPFPSLSSPPSRLLLPLPPPNNNILSILQVMAVCRYADGNIYGKPVGYPAWSDIPMVLLQSHPRPCRFSIAGGEERRNSRARSIWFRDCYDSDERRVNPDSTAYCSSSPSPSDPLAVILLVAPSKLLHHAVLSQGFGIPAIGAT